MRAIRAPVHIAAYNASGSAKDVSSNHHETPQKTLTDAATQDGHRKKELHAKAQCVDHHQGIHPRAGQNAFLRHSERVVAPLPAFGVNHTIMWGPIHSGTSVPPWWSYERMQNSIQCKVVGRHSNNSSIHIPNVLPQDQTKTSLFVHQQSLLRASSTQKSHHKEANPSHGNAKGLMLTESDTCMGRWGMDKPVHVKKPCRAC